LFVQPETIWASPFIIASQPSRATWAGFLFLSADLGVEHVGPVEDSVSVAPGIRVVMVTPFLSLSSLRIASAKLSMNALVPL
jgi:hypothetical protein